MSWFVRDFADHLAYFPNECPDYSRKFHLDIVFSWLCYACLMVVIVLIHHRVLIYLLSFVYVCNLSVVPLIFVQNRMYLVV